MVRPTRIEISTLRAQINAMLDSFEREGVTSVDLKSDHYWAIPLGREFEIDTAIKETEIVVGSLADDIELLDGVLSPGGAIPLAIINAVALLQYLAVRADDLGVFGVEND
jgi:hypothetical protein